ncbi:ionotropic receptor 40a [Pectinophora gossypiella]|uniref:ionotropic receptor 40a n=1 Tax=Pectinophora gossypiella TaxID=13191 RepID=UPI00214E1C27|nr:ionotropic receptor 40a [Pectinophora gossypiella]
MKYIFLLLLSRDFVYGGLFDIQDVISDTLTRLPRDFSLAIKDIAEGLPTKTITVVRGNSTSIRSEDIFELLCLLSEHKVSVVNLDISTRDNKEKYYAFLKQALDTSEERTSLILCEPFECENILIELTEGNLIHRMILYIFYWPYGVISKRFLLSIREAMRVAVITNPRPSVFRVHYNQAIPDRLHHLTLVNWWAGSLYKSPVLPPADKVYHDFKGRIFEVPVLHAPPWHFVRYNNDSTVNVTGGRDDKLLALLAKKLNFRYRYYDPPDRSQGSSISGNGTFKGTLGLIWKRKADFFLGDVTMTWERLQAVEFSFLTLADSGAFLTHAPAKLSETLAIIRPFRWEVWPLVCATILVTGPALWFVIAAPSLWQRRRQNQLRLLNNCCWFTTSLFLRQSSSKEPSNTHKARLVSILISLGATYVIGDMYSANLTSLLARPARERPIGTLPALEEAMRDRGYELVVERHSSSLAILQNGTGVYGRLARLMRRQRVQRVRSVEVGVRLVLSRRHVAVLGGRETLYYDTERFGSHNFHLSEKLYTRYSAIAFQIGCPYLETFNNAVMTLFEGGILAKMTTDEYKNLPEQSRRSEPVTESDRQSSDFTSESAATSQAQPESTKGLEPVSLRMLRGAFCLLGIGHLLAALALGVEIQIHRRKKNQVTRVEPSSTRRASRVKIATKAGQLIRRGIRRIHRAICRHIDRALGPGL